MKAELLAPAGDFEKLECALHFGADAVYCAGSGFGLRAPAAFSDAELKKAMGLARSLGKKLYVAVNIFAHERDLDGLDEFLTFLNSEGADGIIASDTGIISRAEKFAPGVPLHISTQANVTNSYAARFWADRGAKRIVLARELSLKEIEKIRGSLDDGVELEAFVHGAMCVSYSGRCLLSDLFTGRNANRGECVQACRWVYDIGCGGGSLDAAQDGRGTYLFNSKDLCMIEHLKELKSAGVDSFKIEGRTKSAYYVACAVDAYRKAIDLSEETDYNNIVKGLGAELLKSSNRGFTTGFYFGDAKSGEINRQSSKPGTDYGVCAVVKGYDERRGAIVAEQRNRFKIGDRLELLSSDGALWGAEIEVVSMTDADGSQVADAKFVQQLLYIKSPVKARRLDMLRKRLIKTER